MGKKISETAGKAITCKAAICRNPGEDLVIEEIEVAPPQAWEIRIKILCTSLCHTDMTFWKMDPEPEGSFPKILGHEAVGIVESVGEHVEEVKEGELVVPVFLPSCKECRDCTSSKSNLCSKNGSKFYKGMPRDGSSRFRDMKGEVVHHFLFVSSFVEYTVVDIAHVVRLDHLNIPVDKACLLGCGVSTGIGAAWKVADVEEGSTVAIFGLGAVGLAVAEGARLRGASKIIGVDLNPDKFEIGGLPFYPQSSPRCTNVAGKKFGVTHFINPTACGEKTASEVVNEITDGGADYCFECIGLASLMKEAFYCSRQGWGKTVILGVEMHASELNINPHEILRGRSVVGSMFGGLKPKSDIPILAKKYLDKELRLDDFITHEVNFQDINKAFEFLGQGKSIRCIIWMDK